MKTKLTHYFKTRTKILLIFSLFACEPLLEQENINATQQISAPDALLATIIDVPYGADPQNMLDVYTPDLAGSYPCVIFIHGGGWTQGDKGIQGFTPFLSKTSDFNTDGYVFVSINYRLASVGTSPFDMQYDDIEAAINFLQTNAATYNIDATRIALIGYSAGGQLALNFAASYDTDGDVGVVAAIAGPTYLLDAQYDNGAAYADAPSLIGQLESITGETRAMNPTFFETHSPYHTFDGDEPPTALFYGGVDSFIPRTQAYGFCARLEDLSIPFIFNFDDSRPHIFDGSNPNAGPEIDDMYDDFIAFLGTHL